MTKREKEQIKKVIHLLHDTEDGYDDAMTILCNLIGRKSVYQTMSVKGISIPEIINQGKFDVDVWKQNKVNVDDEPPPPPPIRQVNFSTGMGVK